MTSLTELWGSSLNRRTVEKAHCLRADRFREVSIVQRRRIPVPFDGGIVDNLIDKVGSYTGLDM